MYLNITEDNFQHLYKSLEVNTSITNINLYSSKNIGIKYLCESLKKNTTINKIILRNNNIGLEGFQYLGEVLNINSSIREIDLSYNLNDYQSMSYLLKALKKGNKSITYLDLSSKNTRFGRELDILYDIKYCVQNNKKNQMKRIGKLIELYIILTKI
jgi:hypothetical protein